jgi:hypothetical protein
MNSEQLILTLGELKGEVKASRLQISDLNYVVKELDDKIDKLIRRESEREGEANALKRTAAFIATAISLIVAAASAIVR